jgi:hypothetical protein
MKVINGTTLEKVISHIIDPSSEESARNTFDTLFGRHLNFQDHPSIYYYCEINLDYDSRQGLFLWG